MPDPSDFTVGEQVVYEVTKQAQDSFTVPAAVIGHTQRRVLIEFCHWRDDRVVQRAVRPIKLSRRAGAA